MSLHSSIYDTTKHLYVHRARIPIDGSTQMSAPNNVGIYLGFRLKTTMKFMPSFATIILTGYSGGWNYGSTLLLTVNSCTSAPTTGTQTADGPVFSAGTNIFQMNAVDFNAGSSSEGIPGQIGCAVTSQNTISLTQILTAGSYILLRNSSTSLPASVTTIDLFLKGYYLDI